MFVKADDVSAAASAVPFLVSGPPSDLGQWYSVETVQTSERSDSLPLPLVHVLASHLTEHAAATTFVHTCLH